FVPRYEDVTDLPTACRDLGLSDAFADFATRGLFPSDRRLYKHQLDALHTVAKDRRHLVVTTGTGSGKTECFLLPVFEALVRESHMWTGADRPRAIRALLMYPLNALAEDQMVRLRRAADSIDHQLSDGTRTAGARSWFSKYRKDRFYFGRYNGHT